MAYELEISRWRKAYEEYENATTFLESAIDPMRSALVKSGNVTGLLKLSRMLPEDCIIKLYIYQDIQKITESTNGPH